MLNTQWAKFLAFLAINGKYSESAADYLWSAREAIGADDEKEIFWHNHLLYPENKWDFASKVMCSIWPMPGEE